MEFLRPDIVDETIHALQHHSIVQMFQHCLDMGPDGEVLHTHSSFGFVNKTRQAFHPGHQPYEPGAGFMHPYALLLLRYSTTLHCSMLC